MDPQECVSTWHYHNEIFLDTFKKYTTNYTLWGTSCYEGKNSAMTCTFKHLKFHDCYTILYIISVLFFGIMTRHFDGGICDQTIKVNSQESYGNQVAGLLQHNRYRERWWMASGSAVHTSYSGSAGSRKKKYWRCIWVSRVCKDRFSSLSNITMQLKPKGRTFYRVPCTLLNPCRTAPALRSQSQRTVWTQIRAAGRHNEFWHSSVMSTRSESCCWRDAPVSPRASVTLSRRQERLQEIYLQPRTAFRSCSESREQEDALSGHTLPQVSLEPLFSGLRLVLTLCGQWIYIGAGLRYFMLLKFIWWDLFTGMEHIG